MFPFRPKLRTLLARAENAGKSGQWSAASRHYSTILARHPERTDLRVQLGHALKEMGAVPEAEQAYRQAANDDPNHPDAPFHLGTLLLSQGKSAEAVDALACALTRDPLHDGAFEALYHSSLLLSLAPERLASLQQALAAAASTHSTAARKLSERSSLAARRRYACYPDFRPRMTLPPPSAALKADGKDCDPILIQIDADNSAPAFIRMTLDSLLQSSWQNWIAVVCCPASDREHPVASLADIDSRISFASPVDVMRSDHDAVFISAGTVLDREALGWFHYAFRDTNADAVTADWDWFFHSWDGVPQHFSPELHGLADIDRIASANLPSPIIGLRANTFNGPLHAEGRRDTLIAMGLANIGIGHIPLPLAGIGGIAERATIAPENGVPMPIWSQPRDPAQFYTNNAWRETLFVARRAGRPALPCGVIRNPDEAIRVIVPTRDCASELAIAISSLIETAAQPRLVHFTIVNNRSQQPETIDLLRELASRPQCEVIDHDQPFNWSAINNLGAERGTEPILVLANNDIRMLSQGWDDRLRGQLQRPEIGVVGARLLYPDGGIQHAGMIFGFRDRAPVHDGVAIEVDDPQSDPRFDRCQACSAVTGAFLAIRRDTFMRAGRLDAVRFIIAYNDVDLCLAVRELGLKVLYDPGVEAIHYESRTRGLNDNRRKVAWDQEELRALHAKWGNAMLHEPGVSPWWAKDAVYAAFRPLDTAVIAEHLRSSINAPWKTMRASGQP